MLLITKGTVHWFDSTPAKRNLGKWLITGWSWRNSEGGRGRQVGVTWYLLKERNTRLMFQFSYPYILSTWWWKPFNFLTLNIWSCKIIRLKYQRYPTSSWKFLGIEKFELVARFSVLSLTNIICYSILIF